MAGSYGHIVDDDSGRFIGIRHLDNLGDAHEALQECYGMIWYLADGDADAVETARTHYQQGLAMSPGEADSDA